MSKKDEQFFDDLWKAMIEEDSTGDIQPGEMTAEMYAERIGKSISMAARALRMRVKNGTLTRRKINMNGKMAWAYNPTPTLPKYPEKRRGI